MKNSRHHDTDVLDRQQRLGFKKYLEDLKEQAAHIEDDDDYDYEESAMEHISMGDLSIVEGDSIIRTIMVQGNTVEIQEADWEIIRTLNPGEEYCIEDTEYGDVWVTLTEDDYAQFEAENFAGQIDNITMINEFDIGD